MLMPKRTKYRKMQKGRMRGTAWRGSSVSFGDFGLQATECGWITSRQIEATRVAITFTVSPTLHSLASSCALIFMERVMIRL